MVHDILVPDDIQWHPLFIRHYTIFYPFTDLDLLLPNLTFYLIARGFHGTFATGAACQQRTLTLLDNWCGPILGLANVLMLRPISPELVLFPDFWVSNIPRHFCFSFLRRSRCSRLGRSVYDIIIIPGHICPGSLKRKYQTLFSSQHSPASFKPSFAQLRIM